MHYDLIQLYRFLRGKETIINVVLLLVENHLDSVVYVDM